MSFRPLVLLALTIFLCACIPAPKDIGNDYSGPLYRKPGADPARVVTDKPVLPPVSGTGCNPVTEIPSRKRSDCGVRETMQRYNTGIQQLYQRRLAENATLKGNVVLQLNIASDGSVQHCDIASSEIHDAELGRQIIAFVRTIPFGALENVPSWSDTYTLEFAPPPPKTTPAPPAAEAGTTTGKAATP